MRQVIYCPQLLDSDLYFTRANVLETSFSTLKYQYSFGGLKVLETGIYCPQLFRKYVWLTNIIILQTEQGTNQNCTMSEFSLLTILDP